MADEPQGASAPQDVQVNEISPDDFMADEEQAKADPSPVKEAAKEAEPAPKVEDKPESKEEEESPKEEGEAEPKDEKPEDKPAEDPEEQPKGKAEERKEQLNTEIRDLVSRRNALKEQVEKANAEVYQPATDKELLDEVNPETGENFSAIEAKIEAMRQEREMEKYNSQVAEAQLVINTEAEKVMQDFPMFNPENKDGYDKELALEAAELLQASLIIDPNTNQVIGSNVSPYRLYQTLARASGISETKGQIKGQKDTEKMLANADANSSAAPKAEPKDPLIALWESDD